MRGKVMALLACWVLLTACTDAPLAAPIQAPVESADEPALGTLRLVMPNDPDTSDIPWLMAADLLREQGYTVEEVSFADIALTTASIVNGEADVAGVSNVLAWAAVAQGAPLVSFLEKSANMFILLSATEIGECADLDGKNIGIAAVTAVATVMLEQYLAQTCPDVTPEMLVIPGGGSRLAGLEAGALDAALLDIDTSVESEFRSPDRFHPLVVFGQVFPFVQINSFAATRDFVTTRPDAVTDIIRSLLEARRRIQEPGALHDAIVHYLELETKLAVELAALYLDNRLWYPEGSFSAEIVQANIDFLTAAEALPPGLSVLQVADFSYLEAVRGEVTR